MKKTAVLVLLAAAIVLVLYLVFARKQKAVEETVQQPANQNTTRQPISQEPSPASQNMVGNDRDEHGCIGSAGYSWCEVKQKCLRSWEEKCE